VVAPGAHVSADGDGGRGSRRSHSASWEPRRRVHCCRGSGPATLGRSHTWDPDRAFFAHHAFDFRPHFCIRNQLARMELQVALERLRATGRKSRQASGCGPECRRGVVHSRPAVAGSKQHEVRKEWRHCIGENHFGDHSVAMLIPPAQIGIPVAGAAIALQVPEGVTVRETSGVEIVAIPGIEIGPVLLVAPPGMCIG
jgi:hypothetical protein